MKWIISVAVLAVAVFGANAVSPTTPRPQCPPNASWKEGCNDCICDANQRTICTTRVCPTDSEPQTGLCRPGTSWKRSCNTCTCSGAGLSICTQMACLSDDDQRVEVPQPLPDFDRPTGALCLEGQTWRQDCNTCRCERGRATCTRKGCVPTDTTTESGRCIPGSTWKVSCNTCSCVGGRAACTQMACIGGATLPEPEPGLPPKMDAEGRCVTSAVWKEDCNTCRCDQHFYPRCTMMGCLSLSLSESAEIQRPKRQSCSTGDVWKDDCNTCRCTQTGVPACTKMRCIKPSVLDQAKPEQRVA